jgi:hypothetical protein
MNNKERRRTHLQQTVHLVLEPDMTVTTATTSPFAFVATSCCCFVALLLVALLPAAHAGVSDIFEPGTIVACDGVTRGYWGIDSASEGTSTISSWGNMAMLCYRSCITGLHQVRSFSFWLRTAAYTGTPTMATGAVFSNSGPVVSVNISALLPTASSSTLFQSVMADFGSLVKLDVTQTYILAFCATGGGSTSYIMSGVNADDTFRFCTAAEYESCSVLSNDYWSDSNGRSMRTNVTGSCSPASPASQLAPWSALAHIASLLLTALSH